MYAIETSLGRFEADTEKDAKKQLRKAQREQAKRDAEENARSKAARSKACEAAYQIYDNAARGECPPGWRLQPVGANRWAVRETYDHNRGQRGYIIEGDGHESATVFPYDPITHFVENGAGFCIAVIIANQDCDLFAVGVHEGRADWVPLHGVRREWFNLGRALRGESA